jgi:hypothetical protein
MLRTFLGFIVLGGFAIGVWSLATPADSDCDTLATVNAQLLKQRMESLPLKDQLDIVSALGSVQMGALISGVESLQPGSPTAPMNEEQVCKLVVETLSAKGLL